MKADNIEAVIDAVVQGAAYTLDRGGKPVAVVIPYDHWQMLCADAARHGLDLAKGPRARPGAETEIPRMTRKRGRSRLIQNAIRRADERR